MEESFQRSDVPVILLIENDESDVFLFRRALYHAGWKGNVHVVGSATEARAYLENSHPFTDTHYYPRPDLIVSDFRLTGHTALEFVDWMRVQSAFAKIPIVMISGLASGLDPEKLARINPKGVIIKTGDVPKLAEALKPLLPSA